MDFGTTLQVVGIAAAVIGLIFAGAMRGGKGVIWGLGVAGVGLVVIATGWGIEQTLPAAVVSGPSVQPGTSLSSYVTTSSLPAGASWNSVTNVLTVDVVFNYTSNYWGIEAANTSTCNFSSGACHLTNYLLIPVHVARSDPVNVTAGFNMNLGSIPTALTIGGTNPGVAYSFVGYSAATSTSTGQWKAFWDKGALANQNPSASAPSVSTNLLPDLVGVAAFGTLTNTLHLSLAGSNSTTAPTGFYAALTTFSTYPASITIQSSTPGAITVNFIPLGEHA